MEKEALKMLQLKDGTFFKSLGFDKCLITTYNQEEARRYQQEELSILKNDYEILTAYNKEPKVMNYRDALTATKIKMGR